MSMMTSLTKTEDGKLLVAGVLNYTTVPGIQMTAERLLPDLASITVDLHQVEYSNSAGLAMLMAWCRYGARHNKPFEVMAVPAQLLAIAKVTGADKILKLNP